MKHYVKKQSMKIFITGTESFVGKELIKRCKKLNIETYGVDLTVKNQSNYPSTDLRSKELVDHIPEKIDAIVRCDFEQPCRKGILCIK